MPFTDLQFWIVTLAASWGAWVLLRTFLPRRSTAATAKGSPPCATAGCAGCAPGSAGRDGSDDGLVQIGPSSGPKTRSGPTS